MKYEIEWEEDSYGKFNSKRINNNKKENKNQGEVWN